MGDETADAADAVAPIRVFMSYRRADDRHFIGRLHDRLCEAFGDEKVFRDIDSIPAGTNFRNVILRTLNEVDAVVAVIGPNWARPSEGEGTTSPDYVLLELAEALKFGKPVIPVLVESTLMPAADLLPPDLRQLSDIEAISVFGDPAFRRDSLRLIEAIGTVVADDRARLAQARSEAEARRRQLEAERLERERRATELRAEERAARARLAELEHAAVRREIELERARVDALAEQLREAEAAEAAEATAPPVTPATPVPAPSPAPPAAVEIAPVGEPLPRPAPRIEQPNDVASATVPEPPPAAIAPPAAESNPVQRFEVLIGVALVLAVISVPLRRTVIQDGSVVPFTELDGFAVDVTVWLSAAAIAVPLLLRRRPVEQRSVLAGVLVSVVVFDFLQESAVLRFGFDGWDERAWVVVKLLDIACLVAAYAIVRRRSTETPTRSRRHRVPLILLAIAGGLLTVTATAEEWDRISQAVDEGFLPDRSPIAVWLVLFALPAIVVTLVLAMRGNYSSRVALATIATLAVPNYFGEAQFIDRRDLNASLWMWTSLGYLVLAGVAWWSVRTTARPAAADVTS